MRTFTLGDLLRGGVALKVTLNLLDTRVGARRALEVIPLEFVSCRGRGGDLLRIFDRIDGTPIVGLCDPDQSRVEAARSRHPEGTVWADVRSVLEVANIDAVRVSDPSTLQEMQERARPFKSRPSRRRPSTRHLGPIRGPRA